MTQKENLLHLFYRYKLNTTPLYFFGITLIVNSYYRFLSDFQYNSLEVFCVFAVSCFIFSKYKRFEFKLNKEESLAFIEFFRKECGYKEDLYIREIFDNNNNFKYTEILVLNKGDLRVVFEKTTAQEIDKIPNEEDLTKAKQEIII